MNRNHHNDMKKVIFGSVVIILIITILELPPPIGFETRPQTNVSMFWLAFFLLILVSELATMIFIQKDQKLGAKFGLVAATLNIMQVIADQTRMIQPEVATFGYSILEYSVAIVSLNLAYFSWKIIKDKQINSNIRT